MVKSKYHQTFKVHHNIPKDFYLAIRATAITEDSSQHNSQGDPCSGFHSARFPTEMGWPFSIDFDVASAAAAATPSSGISKSASKAA